MDEAIIKKLAEGSGFPEDFINKQLSKRALKKGQVPSEVGLEELRELVVEMLQEVFISIKNGEDPDIEIAS